MGPAPLNMFCGCSDTKMNTELSLPAPVAPPIPHLRASRDAALVALIAVATFVLAATFELQELVAQLTRPLEPYQADELPLTLFVLAVSLVWFASRRWRQAAEQLRLRLAAEQALVDREAQYRLLFTENLAGAMTVGSNGVARLCNPAMARMLGLASPDAAVGRRLSEFYLEPSLWREHAETALRMGRIELTRLELVGEGGRRIQAIARLASHHSGAGGAEFQVYCADITEMLSMQQELAEALAQNRQLSQKYLLAQEEERRKLARELHDEMGQSLNAIKLDAVAIRDYAGELPEEVREGAQSIVEVSSHVYEVARDLMQRLRPVALDELGLADAVRYLVAQWQRRNSDVSCRLELDGSFDGLDEQTNITLYRAVQECLTNITRHARASFVHIQLSRNDGAGDEILLSISDDGVGIEPGPGMLGDRPKAPREKHGGLGLAGLRERVDALGGRLELVARESSGVDVRVRIPGAREGAR